MIQKHSQSEPHDDRWHYLEDRDEKHLENYVEWKYFNFTQKDLSGYIIYYVFDPTNKSGFGGGRLLVRILKDGKSYGLIKKISMNDIELDDISASMRMATAKITEKSPYHYEIDSTAPDLSWNLNYIQHAPSIESFEHIHTGLVRWEKVNWLIKMPKAKVTGTIKIGAESFNIDGLGYSDTNWGEMVPIFTKYEWGQYNDDTFSLVFGVLYGMEKIELTYFYLVLGEHLVKIENEHCEVEHLKWEEDEDIGIKIPVKNRFLVKNEEYEVEFFTTLISRDNPGLKIHPLLPKVVVSEQIVEYEGIVKRKGIVIHEFKGRGFEEWSGKTWKDIPLAFN